MRRDSETRPPSDGCWVIEHEGIPAVVPVGRTYHVLAFADRTELELYRRDHQIQGVAVYTNRRELWSTVQGLLFGAVLGDDGYSGGKPVSGAFDPMRDRFYKREA